MHIRELSGKRICILGYGKEGQAMVRALEKYAPGCEITIADRETKIQETRYKMQTGEKYLENLDRFDVIIKSPGVPPTKMQDARCKMQTTPTQIFFDSIANSGVIVIGVTGSKGKSTTASLIHHILSARSFLVGNIGEPAIAHLEDAKKGTIFVMELSSYQLLGLKISPHIAVITSFFPEHLDYHASTPLGTGSTPLENYMDAKKNITRFQGEDDIVFFCADSHGAAEIAKEGLGRKIPFSASDAPVHIEETHLLGTHNLSNIAAAFAVARELGVDDNAAIAAIKTFHGLPHRLQSLGVHHGCEWIDDAISTTPESTIAALDALGDRIHTIILGGQDRGNDFTELGKRIAESSIKQVILFPGSGPRIRKAIEDAGADVTFFEANSMEEAVNSAMRLAMSDKRIAPPIVLLSTASPSYGMFKNFEDKGDCFRKCISVSH